MKIFVCALASVVGLVSPALAADTQPAWEGFLTITSATSACSGVGGTGVGETFVSLYRPKIASTDVPAGASLSIILTRAAISLTNTSESSAPFMKGSGNLSVIAINGRGKPFSYSATFSSVVVTPSPVTASTATVGITGTFNTYWNTTGCNVGFKATYVKRID